jgi:hypothetical protein
MTNISASELEAYLHDRIPLSAAMQVAALAVSLDAVSLGAPLRPNTGHEMMLPTGNF